VVDTKENCERVISYLKENKLGSLKILCLNKMTQNYQNHSFKAPHNAKRIFDLIKLDDPKYAPVFYYGLRDTLVVPSLNNDAINLAYTDRHRVVTFKGELIENSGLMTGGGEPRKGLIRLSNQQPHKSSEEIHDLEKNT